MTATKRTASQTDKEKSLESLRDLKISIMNQINWMTAALENIEEKEAQLLGERDEGKSAERRILH